VLTTPPGRPISAVRRSTSKDGYDVVGARKFLIAFNVNLATSDLKIARRVARAAASLQGGPTVKAMGILLA
jgi:glutamate formiminotransferase